MTYLPNFPDLSFRTEVPNFEHINDVPVILCVANLRFPKNHTNLISSIEILHNEKHTFKVWLVGKDFHDQYSTQLKAQIASAGLEKIIDILDQHHIKNTRIYWLLSRCLQEDPKDRSIILI